MSEKGQGEGPPEGSATGTGVGIDGTPSGGSGSQADQTGPQGGDTQTRTTIEDALKKYDDRERERTFMEGLGKPEIPDMPEDLNPPEEHLDLDPPSLQSESDMRRAPTDRPPGLSEEEFEQWKKDHPSIMDKANTQTDVT